MRVQQTIHLVFAGMIVASLLGCDSGPAKAPVTGKVTYAGNIVPEGTVTFYPSAGGRPAVGELQPDGTYALSYTNPGDGAVLGDYVVTIDARRIVNPVEGPKSIEEELAGAGSIAGNTTQVEWLVPEEYAARSTTQLTATVEDRENIINFELP